MEGNPVRSGLRYRHGVRGPLAGMGPAKRVAAGVAGATPIQTVSFASGFIGGTVAWAFGMAFAIRWSKRIMSPAIFRVVNLACGGALVVFGFTLASQMLG